MIFILPSDVNSLFLEVTSSMDEHGSRGDVEGKRYAGNDGKAPFFPFLPFFARDFVFPLNELLRFNKWAVRKNNQRGHCE